MANTRDELGEQATLDLLVRDEISTLEEDGITYLGRYSLRLRDGLKTLIFPNITKTLYAACTNCKYLTTFIAPNLTSIDGDTFEYCYRLHNFQSGILKTIGSYAFRFCYRLSEVDVSEVQTIQGYAFTDTLIGKLILPAWENSGNILYDNKLISDVDIYSKKTLTSKELRYGYNLTAVILRNDSVVTAGNTVGEKNEFPGTPIDAGIGYIYVPNYLVDVYKADEKWSVYSDQIVSIDEYPKQLQNETITDSWEQIFASEDNNTYYNKYQVGDTKYVRINGANVLMEIVAMDKDILTDTNGRAKITWMSKNLNFVFMASDPTGKTWIDSDIRSYLYDDVFPLIDTTVRNRIQNVRKYTRVYASSSSSQLISSEKIWIPSQYEIGMPTSQYGSHESEGVTYSDYYNSNESRIKTRGQTGSALNYLLRTQSSSNNYYYVTNSGSADNSVSGTNTTAICFGFCT